MGIYSNEFTQLDKQYREDIRIAQEESMRTWVDMADTYENIRSNYIIRKTQLEVALLSECQDRR